MTRYPGIAEAHLFTDQATAHMAATSAGMGRPVTCSKGCFACCKEPVLASRDEALYIIESLSPKERKRVAAETKRWAHAARYSRVLDEPVPHVYNYRALNLWCPLLLNGQCSVYKRRPVGCRLHMVSGPPANCFDNEQRLHQEFIMSPEIADACTVTLGVGVSKNLGVWLAEFLCGIVLKTAGVFVVKKVGDELELSLEYEEKHIGVGVGMYGEGHDHELQRHCDRKDGLA